MKHETEQKKHVARRDGVCLAFVFALATIPAPSPAQTPSCSVLSPPVFPSSIIKDQIAAVLRLHLNCNSLVFPKKSRALTYGHCSQSPSITSNHPPITWEFYHQSPSNHLNHRNSSGIAEPGNLSFGNSFGLPQRQNMKA